MTMIQIDAKTVPALLRAVRALSGLTVREMGQRVGVSHGTVSAWEQGRGEPSVTQMILWSRAAGQDPAALIAGLEVASPVGLEAGGDDRLIVRFVDSRGCPCRTDSLHGRGDCPFGCSCGWCAPELWDEGDPYTDAAFWAIIARQAFPDAVSTFPEDVAR